MSRAVLWICLLVVLSTTAYGFQTAASRLPSPTSSTRMVQISWYDSGEIAHMECFTTTDRYAEDVLLVELKDVGNVAAQLCTGADPPPAAR